MSSEGATLGAVLYANPQGALVSESEWVDQLSAVRSGDQPALFGLFERAHEPVLTLASRITGSRERADDVMLDVFAEIRHKARDYDPAAGSVSGWIMNTTRSLAKGLRRHQVERSAEDDRLQLSADELDALRLRLAIRLAANYGGLPSVPLVRPWVAPSWNDVAPGISCKLLSTDERRDRVSMLVRLVPGAEYPPHTHAGTEELHLLEGELWIDERKLFPGEYSYASVGSADKRVASDTGCICFLMTSTRDQLG
jgi:anti-sigma factor ChrR (cupin superfamily)